MDFVLLKELIEDLESAVTNSRRLVSKEAHEMTMILVLDSITYELKIEQDGLHFKPTERAEE